MPTTPERPPGRRDGRRPTKGRSVLRRRNAIAAFSDTEQAIAALEKKGSGKQAAAVQAVLDYARYASNPPIARGNKGNLSLEVSPEFSTHCRDKAAIEGVTLSAVVEEYFLDYLADLWTPVLLARAPKGSETVRVDLNVQIDKQLTARVAQHAKDLTRNNKRPPNTRQIAIAALLDAFPMTGGSAPRPKRPTEKRQVWMSRSVRDQVKAAAQEEGVDINQLITNRLEKFAAGRWMPLEDLPVITRKGDGPAYLKFTLPEGLSERVQQRADEIELPPTFERYGALPRLATSALRDEFPDAFSQPE